ncbi:hypothetical protein [Candidatus Nephthysia bennettiae]|uniref:Uncharacterized protein n=1 Tax=Candidatus Nephthysia bennettiae TaxID=3127016 RepID=A0A934JYP2_9BACT|nr:hypothetical protein [Candidatus Dormibacteraeota bacterium]
MKHACKLTASLVALACASAPAAASAATIELGGATTTAITTPTCPPGVPSASCQLILTRTTGLETIRDSVAYPTTVTKSGVIVAWTVGLASLSSSRTMRKQYIHSLDASYGGTSEAAIVVLKSGRKRLFTVVTESPVEKLQPYLGTVVQFPLATPIAVTRGEVIGLAVPTWAPVLSYNLPTKKFAYRQSRIYNCKNPAAGQTVQDTAKAATRYECNYPGARVEYRATEIPMPVPPKNYVR